MSDINIAVGLDTVKAESNANKYLKTLDQLVAKYKRIEEQSKDLSKVFSGQSVQIAGLGSAIKSLNKATKDFSSNAQSNISDLDRYKNSVSSLSAEVRELRDRLEKVDTSFRNTGSVQQAATRNTASMAAGFGVLSARLTPLPSLMNLLASAVSVYAGIRIADSILQTNRQLEGMQAALKVVTGTTEGAEKAFNELSEISEDLGVNILGASDGFKQMQAAAAGANFDLNLSKQAFTSVLESARALNLGTEDVKGTLRALTQIMSKGTVNLIAALFRKVYRKLF